MGGIRRRTGQSPVVQFGVSADRLDRQRTPVMPFMRLCGGGREGGGEQAAVDLPRGDRKRLAGLEWAGDLPGDAPGAEATPS